MTLSEKRYYEILTNLQTEAKTFSTVEQKSKLFTTFTNKLKQIFKLNITFDSIITKVILKRLETQFQHYYYGQNFVKTLNFLNQFTKLIKKEKFINLKDEKKIINRITQFKEDPCFKYYSALCYLRDSKQKDQFRLDFLYNYMDMKEDEEQYEDWQDEDYKKVYRKFWKRLMTLDPKPTLVTYIYSCFTKFQNPYEMLTDDLVEKINQKMGENIGKTEIQVDLNNELKHLAIQNYYQTSSEAKDRINKEYQIIQKFLHKFQATKKIVDQKLELHVSKFGSLISGFAGTDSDLDITILTNSYVNESNFLHYLADFLKIQFSEHDKKTGRTTKVQKIDASTPLVEVQIQGDRRQGTFKIDILVNNVLGVINSKFLSVYAQVTWIKQLGILFKLWAKSKGVIGKQLLSSYAIILMMINFLINKNYVNLMYNANQRDKQTPRINFKRWKNGFEKPDQFEIFFQFDTKIENVTKLKTVNLAQIMKELFHYYSEEGGHWKNEGKNIISVDGTYDKEFDNDCVFTIKDPFDKPHNPGRAKATHQKFFKERFNEGYYAIKELQNKSKQEDRLSLLSSVFEKF